MSEDDVQIEELLTRIKELEDKVEALRISRRVLMNLIEAVEREKKEKISHLELMNERLQRNNCRYAKTIMLRNVQILNLEEQLKNITIKNTLR